MMTERPPDSGMQLAAITDETRKRYGLDSALTGALVSAVEQDCEARELGVVPGDVIVNVQGRPIASPDDVRNAIENAHEQRRGYLAMLIQAKNGLRWISLSITGAGS
jgi:serine protease Do